MAVRENARLVWKWLWLLVLCTAVGGFFAWLAVRDRPPVFATSTTLIIGQAIEKRDPGYLDFDLSGQLLQTYSELIKTEQILRPVARQLGIEPQWPLLREQVEVELVPGTLLMKIRVTDNIPLRAQLIANAAAGQLIASAGSSAPSSQYRTFIEEQAAGFPPKIEAAQQEIRVLEEQLREAFGARQIQDIQEQVDTLEGQIKGWQDSFAQYQVLLGEGGINVLSQVERAPLPTQPIGPNWIQNILAAAAVSFFLALGAVILIEYLDDTVKTPEDLGSTTQATTVGVIPQIEGSGSSDRLITVRQPKSPISEAFRVMRTNLQFSSLDQPPRSLVVTSPSPSEGKSTMVANLGVVMAQAGYSVLVVDSDLRRPTLHNAFRIENRFGLTNLLLQDTLDLDGSLQESGVENLRILTSGPLPPNPSELLGSRKMGHLIEQLESHVDIVLFDTPPTLPVTDAALLSRQTDGVLLVADARRTRRGSARLASANLRQVGGQVLGACLNRAPRRGPGGYYSYYYYYHSAAERGESGQGRARPGRRPALWARLRRRPPAG